MGAGKVAAIAAAAGLGLFLAQPAGLTAPRGIRNNNPGNIRISSAAWLGKIQGADSSFETFSHAVYGIRAMARILVNYQAKYDLNTVRQIINRWAPPVENDTGAYVAHVAEVLGVDPDQAIEVRQVLPQLLPVIIKHENGVQPYSQELINQGVAIA